MKSTRHHNNNNVIIILLISLFLICGSNAIKNTNAIHIDLEAPTPAAAALLVTQQIINNSANFLKWDYGCAIIYDAMWEALSVFGGDYEPVLNKYLDQYINTPNNFAYEVLHNITIPWAGEIGDTVGLFPIAYLARAKYYSVANHSYDNTTDLQVAYSIARQYVVPYPYRLPDGTYSRSSGWAGEQGGNHTFVWSDDSFMGMALLSRLAIVFNNPAYLTSIQNQQLTYAGHLRDTIDGLFHHGYNDFDHHQSCCKWSRANGWLVMSHAEVLLALQHLNNNPTLFNQIKDIFVSHSQAAAKVQSPDGRWHQLLNETSTFLETSTTGMFLLSFINGVENGWLDKSEFDPVIQLAWKGLLQTIQSNGVVTGICTGTGIGTDVNDYETRPTDYLGSSPGLGSVLRAISAYQRYSSSSSPSSSS